MNKETEPVEPSRNVKIVAGVVLALIAIFVITGIASLGSASSDVNERLETAKNTEPAKEEPKADTRDLDLMLRPTPFGLDIKNNEAGELKNCTVVLNPGFTGEYKAVVPVINGEESTIAWGDFTKGDERFDYQKLAVKELMVRFCEGLDSRFGSYKTT